MARGLTLLAGLLAVGCSGDPPPIREAAPISTETVVLPEFAPPKTPDKSDPAAAKLLSAVLEAHGCTGAATLAKLKAVSLHRIGTTSYGGGRVQLDWRADLLAPGLYRVDAEFQIQPIARKFHSVVTPAGGSQTHPNELGQVVTKLEGETLKDCHAQQGEDELLLLYPLADPATVAVPGPQATVNGASVPGIYVWTPGRPPALLHFDKATGRLGRVVYLGRESGKEVLKEVVIRELKSFGGVWLPTKYELAINGRPFLEVESQTFELGKTFPKDHFKP